MKHYLSLFLCAVLLLGVFAAVPAAAAADLRGYPDDHYPLPDQEFIYLDGTSYRTGELDDGVSYYFRNDVTLALDENRTCPVIYTEGSLTIEGDATLTGEILYAEGSAVLDSGTVVCPVMDNPPEASTLLVNGLRGAGGVSIKGGCITAPVIYAGGEHMTSVSGGEVHVGSIGALYGYSQTGGIVEADRVWGREGVFVCGGRLTVGSINHDYVFDISFPMVISEPAGAAYSEETGGFIDAEGKPVERVTISKAEFDFRFTDVEPYAWYYQPACWAVYYCVANGTDATHFSPNNPCTRAQAMTFLWRASGSPAPKNTDCAFVDVASDAWYRSAVLWAVEAGITNGTDATHFSPNDPCTRAQAVTFLWRALSSQPDPDELHDIPFHDVKPTDYFAAAACWGDRTGIVKGTGAGVFSPKEICSRAMLVAFLCRADVRPR